MWFFNKPKGRSVALIDIGSSSVGGALVHLQEGAQPTVCYTVRTPLSSEQEPDLTSAMLRALTDVGEKLVREGSPALRECAGSGSIDKVLVSISSPWQESQVDTKTMHAEKPFIFSKGTVEVMLGGEAAKESRTETKAVIATLLNGYRTNEPYGKKAERAELVVLTSSLQTTVVESVGKSLRQSFHTKDITYTAFAEACYAVLRDLYPHEKEFLVISVTGEGTDIASIKRGHLVDIGTIPHGTNALLGAVRAAGNAARVSIETPAPQAADAAVPTEAAVNSILIDKEHNAKFSAEAEKAEGGWVDAIATLLQTFAARHALPRTVFLVADEEVRGFLKTALGAPSLHALWLSDEPISVLPVEPSQLSSRLKTKGQAEGDTALGLLALYAETILH